MKNKIIIISSIIASIFIIMLACMCTGCTSSDSFINESIASSSISTTITTLKTIEAGTTTTLTLENNSTTSDKKIETTSTEPATMTATVNNSTVNKNSSTTFTSEIITTVAKNNDEIALEVIRGKWGVGLERKKLLEKAGYDYDTIQCIVNNILGKNTTVATTETSNISTTATETTIVEKTTINTTEAINTSTETDSSSITSITEDEYILLCKLVANEYGGMSDVTERAKIVAAVMNQVERSGDSIETCIYRSCVPWGFNPNKDYYYGIYYGDMADAVEYYITNGTSGFYNSGYWVDGADSWWGDGKYNHFYRA